MSFFLNNITTEKMFDEILQDRRIVLVRFGVAEKPECQRLDRIISSLDKSINTYFSIAAYEKKDVSKYHRKKYNITDTEDSILIFFFNSHPIYISFNKKPNFQVTDKISNPNELLSLLVIIHQSIKHNRKTVYIYGQPSSENKSPKKQDHK